MKKLIAIILTLIMVTAMTACTAHSHTETENWEVDSTGHWKVCQECGEKAQSGDHTLNDESKCTVCGVEILEWDDSVSVHTFDEYGNLTRLADYDTHGELISDVVFKYEYDADGNITNTKEYIDGQFANESEFVVNDSENYIAKYTQYNEDGSMFINEYDSYGNITVLISYDAEGNVDLQTDSQYAQDAEGEWYESACTEVYGDGMKIEVEYNEQGDATSRLIYDADGNVTSDESWEYTYDENGFTTTMKEYVDGVLATEMIYKIVTEDDGMFGYPETVTTYHEDGGKTVCVYDEFDDLISETKYDASGNVIE